MAAPIEIDVWQGDIAELEVDALVVSANESLFMTGGAAAAVKRRGGEEIERAAVEQGPVSTGTAIVTPAGSLAASYVIHAVAVGHDRAAEPARLRGALDAALAFAQPLQLRRLAMALIGVDFGTFPPDEAAIHLVDAIMSADAPLESVVLATASSSETRAVSAALAARRAGAR
jgi:O-acetyl-ADP-ribose deacetylase (regulator of RNase III)